MRTLVAVCSLLVMLTSQAFAEVYKLAIHVSDDDIRTMNLALNNAQNVKSYYEAQGDTAIVEIVAYGPGLKMYTADSPVKSRLDTMGMDEETFKFSACGNTLRNMSEKLGEEVQLVEQAHVVPAGVVRLMELQNEGYAYLRP